jgi:hypothetical protein
MIGRLAAAMTMSAIFAVIAHAANCPSTECNYLDSQYKAAMDVYEKCAEPINAAYEHAMDQLAVVYPKFGIAWQSEQAEFKSISSDFRNTDIQPALDEVHRRFEDRVLATAEPEALQAYNRWKLKVKRDGQRCGPLPLPPRKQP